MNFYKTSTLIVIETEIKDGVAKKTSTLVVATDNSGKVLNISTLISNSALIIYYGVTNHMTFDYRQVSHLNSSS